MLDIQTETLISLADAALLLPGLRPGTRMSAGSVRQTRPPRRSRRSPGNGDGRRPALHIGRRRATIHRAAY